MKRIKGRIDLLEGIGDYKKAIRGGKLKEAKECTTKAYWIKDLEGINYLFKTYESDNQMYRSLLVEKIANQMGIPFAHTDLANFGYYDGELIVDYRRDGYDYIPGSNILMEYFHYLKDGGLEEFSSLFPNFKLYQYTEDEILLRMNNLVTIRHALSHRFRKWNNGRTITDQILEQLEQIFYLDFLTMQRDRGHHNWEIEENVELQEASLPPLIDSNRSFYFPSFEILLNPYPNIKATDLYEKLELQFELGGGVELVDSLYQRYTPEVLSDLLEEIETELHFHMEPEAKIEILSSYKEHYSKLEEVMKKQEGRKR